MPLSSVFAQNKVEFSPNKTFTQVSYVSKSPKVDGKISPNEYMYSFENFGTLIHNRAFLSSRQAKYFAAMDGQNLYLACQSEVPEKDTKLKLKKKFKKRDSQIPYDDCVEFLFMPTDGAALFHLIVNPADVSYDVLYPVVNGGVSVQVKKDWDPKIQIKSTVDNKYWTLEVKIPLKEMNVKVGKFDRQWLFQFARSWTNPRQQCAFNKVHVFANKDGMNPVSFTQNTPVVRFTGMGEYYKGNHDISFVVDNPTNKVARVKYQVYVTSEAAPRNLDGEIILQPKESKTVALKFKDTSKLSCEMNMLFTNAITKKTILQRTISWQNPRAKRWIAPDVKTGATLEIGIYPYYKLIRARIGNHSLPINVNNVKSAIFRVTDLKGKALTKNYIPKKEASGFYAQFPLPKLAKGNYFVEARLMKSNNKEEVYKGKFFFDKFEWENNKIGMDRIVLPPYQPLKYLGKSSVKTLMSQYDFAYDNQVGLISKIASGKAKNLLAEPIIIRVNNQVAKNVKGSFAFIEKSKDLALIKQNLAINNLNLAVNHQVEYDNFIKTTLVIKPKNNFKFNSMTLDIPLETAFAKQIHTTCNTMKYNAALAFENKDGQLWNSMQGKLHPEVSNNFRPYIWVGNMAEGLAFFAESDKNWSRNANKPMAQVIRKGNKTVLRINFIDKPMIAKKEFKLVFGFQATPTRTRPNSSRQLTERFKVPNSVNMSLLAGGGCWACVDYDFWPINRDYTFIKALRNSLQGKLSKDQANAIVSNTMKHFSSFTKERQIFYKRHLDRGIAYAKNSNCLVPYINPRATHLRWKEYQVYMDEWFCSNFRANNEDDYNNTPTKSYQDFLLYCGRKLIQAGLDGIYYDNIRDWHNTNMVTGPAYLMDNGKIQPYFDIFDMRELIKRTAVMVYKEGKRIFDNRPLFVLHMTNTNIVPFLSFGSIQLDMEAMFGAMDFQDRFTEDYIKVCTLGLQTGSIPEVLIQISGDNKNFVTRTFLAVTLAYDLPMVLNAGGTTAIWVNTWKKLKSFGYGTNDVKVYPTFNPSNTITTTAKKLRFCEYHKNNNEVVIAVSSFGHSGKATINCKFPIKEAIDWESGKPLKFNKNSVEINILKNDFKLIKIKK